MKELLCIVCPNGCRLRAEEREGTIAVTGNRCKRGFAFALAELTNPTRTVTTTVRTAFPEAPALPVRTDREIPKGKIGELMGFLKTITVSGPLGCGDVVAENALGLGCNIIATSHILKEGSFQNPAEI
jgi:CxxC motif-containing protein